MLKKLTALTLGLCLSVSALAVDVATLTKQAESENVNAQFDLGYEYYNQANYSQAFYWYQKSAKLGSADAQNNLGVIYAKGHGVRQNYRTAKKWYGNSCDNGNQTGCEVYQELKEQGY